MVFCSCFPSDKSLNSEYNMQKFLKVTHVITSWKQNEIMDDLNEIIFVFMFLTHL